MTTVSAILFNKILIPCQLRVVVTSYNSLFINYDLIV